MIIRTFENIDNDDIEESDDELLPSSEEEYVLLTPPTPSSREKGHRKSEYPFKCEVCDESFKKNYLECHCKFMKNQLT